MKRPKDKLFIVRKFVAAPSASAALRKEKKTAVHDVYIDEDWKRKHEIDTYAVGFEYDPPEESEYEEPEV